MKDLIILGTGGNCIDILDAVNEINSIAKSKQFNCIGFLDDADENFGKEFHGIKVIGKLSDAKNYSSAFFINGIGSPFNFRKKKSIIDTAGIAGGRFINIIHPSAVISKMAKLGNGIVILQNAVIASGAVIGDHVIILPNAVISHDDNIGPYTSIAAGVCISGGVTVGSHCYMGTNSSVIGNITIGDNSMIGMGSVVLKDVPSGSVVAGNPARPVSRK